MSIPTETGARSPTGAPRAARRRPGRYRPRRSCGRPASTGSRSTRRARHLRRAVPRRDRLPALHRRRRRVLAFAEPSASQRRPPHRPHRHRGRPRDHGPGHPGARRLADDRDPRRRRGGHEATVQCGVPLQVLEDRLREQGLTTGHSPSPSRSPRSAAWSRPGPSASSPRCTAASRTWSSAWRRSARRHRHPDQERPPAGRRPRRPAPGHRQRGRAVLRHRGDRQAVPATSPENKRFHGYLVDDLRTGSRCCAR